ncbi:MAG TPA: hypothetical protein VLM85_30460 [Polyangiaceae bacterium]|nr:hypothetical protein [Polyangiaceae bacterium]
MRVLRPPSIVDHIEPIAAQWVASARAALEADDELARAALATNFGWDRAPASDLPRLRSFIAEHFASIERVLDGSHRLFRRPWPWDVRRFFGETPPPAYAHDGHVYFTDEFRPYDGARGFGPKCLAAMVIHESVHVFDARSGEPEIHISEWDEPKFSAVPPDLQIHNPSAYASFAGQVHHGQLQWPREARFGAGRRAD